VGRKREGWGRENEEGERREVRREKR